MKRRLVFRPGGRTLILVLLVLVLALLGVLAMVGANPGIDLTWT